MSDIPDDAVRPLVNTIARRLRLAHEDEIQRIPQLKEAAKAVVRLRGLFTTDDGLPDWAGRSSEYRATIREAYRAVPISSDERKTLVYALRYHVGNALRDLVPGVDLVALGLTPKRPVERVRDFRERQSEDAARVVQLEAHIKELTARIRELEDGIRRHRDSEFWGDKAPDDHPEEHDAALWALLPDDDDRHPRGD